MGGVGGTSKWIGREVRENGWGGRYEKMGEEGGTSKWMGRERG